MCRRQAGAAVHVVVPAVRGDCASRWPRATSSALGIDSNDSFTGLGVEAVMVSANCPSRDSVPIASAPERPSGASEICRKAVRRVSASAGSAMLRRISPGRSTFCSGAEDEIGHRHLPFATVGRPQGAHAVERGGQRDHRPCGQ